VVLSIKDKLKKKIIEEVHYPKDYEPTKNLKQLFESNE
jgi:hypothetical protein